MCAGIVAALVLPTAVGAQKVKEVEVTNLPEVQAVEVGRFQLVGFTDMTYVGNLGGWFGATEKCQVDFAGARICTFDEARNTTTLPVLPVVATLAWIGNGCASWVKTDEPGTVLKSDTGLTDVCECGIPHPIACCALVP